MPEPGLSEIADIKIDPAASGIAPRVAADNTSLVNQLNENARFHANQDMEKYKIFLQNKKDLFQNIGDIQGLQTLAEDKPELNKQVAGILESIQKDPSVIAGGKGYTDVLAKMSKFKSDSMASKQFAADDKLHRDFLENNPAYDTEENKAAIEKAKGMPLQSRVSPQLKLPPLIDINKTYDAVLKDSAHTYSEPKEINGVPYLVSGTELSPKSFKQSWNEQPSKTDANGKPYGDAIQRLYQNAPDKYDYEQKGGGGWEKWWQDKGQRILDEHLSQFSDQNKVNPDDAESNIRYDKKTGPDMAAIDLIKAKADAEYKKESLAIRRQTAEISAGRLNVEIGKRNDAQKDVILDGVSVLSDMSDVIKNGQPSKIYSKIDKKPIDIIRVEDPNVMQKYNRFQYKGKTYAKPDGMYFIPSTNQAVLYWKGQNTDQSGAVDYKEELPMTQREWASITAKSQGFTGANAVKAMGAIDGILKQNNNSLWDVHQKLSSNEDENAPAKSETKPTVKKEINRSDIHSKAQAAGYTDKEYEALLKKNGVIIK